MSENPIPDAAVSDREVQAQAQRVNQLLRELEQQLDDNQHAVLTEFFAERAVLSAMKMRVDLEELQKRQAAGKVDGSAEGTSSAKTDVAETPSVSAEAQAENSGADDTKGVS
ncbi:MAG TPA: hypothetical protein VH186_10275 [Chloroflexia bacterium]|nr:hypothetical protein [Chloroflexia bacterium]